MNSQDKKIDWSDKCFREMLVYQRKSAIHKHGRDRIAGFYGLRPGMTVLDVGCGLGFLGRNYWGFFGEGGHYIGVDVSPDLLEQARKGSSEWADGGEASFTAGDVYSLPFADNTIDAVMCQTLLMHLKDPEQALREMIRVVKPGGVVICQEPDNLTPQLKKRHWSLPDDSIEDLLLRTKVAVLCNKGRIKLGLGDDSIGPRVYLMMRQLGLTTVDVTTTEYVPHLYPPYTDKQEKVQLEMIQKQVLDDERSETLRERWRRDFMAGGGTPEEWARYCTYGDKLIAQMREQINDECYFYCGAYPQYYTKGIKPRN
ncbi:MAG: methyltransferase domain-containing protein [candidate division Zixibacteria bacterium]|nr:methyltransferase domain-containing protein [candidate division Zixibacteria bacterium]